MRRTAVDCLRRGFLSSRANWGLVPMKLLQDLLLSVLLIASFVPPLLVLGGFVLLEGGFSEAALQDWIAGLGDEIATRVVPLVLAVVASLVIGLLAVVVWAWFEGGMLGVLVAAERQALPRAEDAPGGWRWFRTFTLRDFSGWGGRYLWRYFWFFHLALTVSLVFAFLLALLLVGAVAGNERWGPGAAIGIGCGGALPLVFAVVVYALWFSAAQPAVALEGSGSVRGSALGLRVVGRRLGASLLIGLTFLVVLTVVYMVLALGNFAAELFLKSSVAAWLTVYLSVTLVQLAVSSALNVYLLAAFSSLVVAEAGGEPQ